MARNKTAWTAEQLSAAVPDSEIDPDSPEWTAEESTDDAVVERTQPVVRTVLLLCDHVYLPEDPTADDWESARVTVRYDGKTEDGRRTRVDVCPSLATFLQDRDQAEIID